MGHICYCFFLLAWMPLDSFGCFVMNVWNPHCRCNMYCFPCIAIADASAADVDCDDAAETDIATDALLLQQQYKQQLMLRRW